MYGIGSKTAGIIALTTLALAVFAAPVYADGSRRGGHGDDRHGGHAPRYEQDDRHGYRDRHEDRHRHRHRYWRRHGHHGVRVHDWKPFGHRHAYGHRRIHAACHPVVGHGHDHFGRRAKFGGTMCYDRFGRGYVVAGSRYVIRYF